MWIRNLRIIHIIYFIYHLKVDSLYADRIHLLLIVSNISSHYMILLLKSLQSLQSLFPRFRVYCLRKTAVFLYQRFSKATQFTTIQLHLILSCQGQKWNSAHTTRRQNSAVAKPCTVPERLALGSTQWRPSGESNPWSLRYKVNALTNWPLCSLQKLK